MEGYGKRGDCFKRSKCDFERERAHSTSWQTHSRCTDDILMVVDFYYNSTVSATLKHWTQEKNPKTVGFASQIICSAYEMAAHFTENSVQKPYKMFIRITHHCVWSLPLLYDFLFTLFLSIGFAF